MASFGDRIVGAMKLNPATFQEVEHDPTALGQAVGVIVLAAVASGIGTIWFTGVTGLVMGVLRALVAYLIWAGLVWLIGTRLMPDPATKADFPETFRVVAFAAAPGLLSVLTIIGIIPILGWLIAALIGFLILIWTIAAMVIAVREVLDYANTGKAAIVVLIGAIGYLVISAILSAPRLYY
jgi:hypothetical protein